MPRRLSLPMLLDLPMRTHGTLAKWNDDRGFGFVAPAHGNEEIFVHVSAFPSDGVRPYLNELISFEIEVGKDGRKRAVRVMRAGSKRAPRRRDAPAEHHGMLAAILGLLAAGGIGAYGYKTFGSDHSTGEMPASDPLPQEAAIGAPFACDGRTRCSQMTSCAEARYFLQHCPGVRMDGDNDGEPCEAQWCR